MGLQRFPRHLRAPKVIRFGSDFTGIKSASVALKRLNVNFKTIFSSDNAPDVNKLLNSNIMKQDGETVFGDVLERKPEQEENVDLYVSTPPCQSFAAGGKGKGINDPRGKLVAVPAQFCQRNRPRAVVLEETVAFTFRKYGKVRNGLLRAFKSIGYEVHHTVLAALHFKAPQKRRRFIMVAIRKDSRVGKFEWPSPQGSAKLGEILDPKKSKDVPGMLPKLPRARRLVQQAYKAVWSKGVDPRKVPIAVDIDCSPGYATYGIDIAPTLTKTRGEQGGPFVSTCGRRVSMNEMMRLQGFEPSDIPNWEDVVTKNQFGGMIGNSVPVGMMQAVLQKTLVAAGLVSEATAEQWASDS